MFFTWMVASIIAGEVVLYLVFVFADRGRPRPIASGWFYFALCLGLFAMAGTSLLAYTDTLRRVKELGTISVRYRAVDRLMRDLREMEIGQRGYLITGREDYLEPYLIAREHVRPACDALRSAYAGSDEDGRAGRLCRLSELKVEEMERVVALKRDGNPVEALEVIQSDSGKNFMDLAKSTSDEMLRRELAAYDRTRTDLARVARARIGMAWLVILGSVFQMAMGATHGWPARHAPHHPTAPPNHPFMP